MSRSINKVTLIGTLGHDPEIKYLPNGSAAARISLATNEDYNDKTTGQKIERTEWHRVIIYGKLAEIAHQYLRKGSKAYFEGRLQTRSWEKEGVKRFTTEVIANQMLMLDGKPAVEAQSNTATPVQTGYPQAAQPMPTPPPTMESYSQQPVAPRQPATPPPGYRPPTPMPAPEQAENPLEDIPF